MSPSDPFPRNVPFRPSPALVSWFILDFVLFMVFILAVAIVPALVATGPDHLLLAAVLAGILGITVVFAFWTRLYYDSMWYELHDDEMRWKRGVWFRTTGIVPYNRITNIDLRQGPVMRWLKISSISIQTAGYSGQGLPEIRIEAIEHADELRELIRTAVRQCSALGDGTGQKSPARQADEAAVGLTATNLLIINELKKIRVLLEEQQKK